MADLAPPPLRAQLRVCRQVLYWYHVDHDAYPALTAPQLPVFLWFRRATGVYGFPAVNGPDGGLKVGYHDYTTTVSASAPKTPVSDAEVRTMYRDRVGGRIRGVRPQLVRAVTCYYTMTSDHRFVIDHSPDNERIVFVSACSGQGFKHSAGIGDAVAQLITTGASNIDLKPFTLTRFGRTDPTK